MPEPAAAAQDMTPTALLPDAIVVGEALVDIIMSHGHTKRVPGGSPMNVAVGLGRLGHSVSLVAAVGDDELGLLVRNHLESSTVDLTPAIGADRTSTAVARLDEAGVAEYEFDLSWPDRAIPRLPWSRIVHVGSLSSWHDPAAIHVIRLLRETPSSTLVTFDPNIRGSLISDRDAAMKRIEDIAGRADLVKLSEEDAAWMYPGLPITGVLGHLLSLGTSVAVATLGGKGAVAMTPNDLISLPARSTQVADTIGAGDSFMAGLLDAWLRAEKSQVMDPFTALPALVERGLETAAVTVSRFGADPPWATEVSNLGFPARTSPPDSMNMN